MKDKVQRAWKLAEWAHEGQYYRPGVPYFSAHILDVWVRCLEAGGNETVQIVALLHDILDNMMK